MFSLSALVGFAGGPFGGWLADRWVFVQSVPPGGLADKHLLLRIGRKMTIRPAAGLSCAGKAGGGVSGGGDVRLLLMVCVCVQAW